MATSTITNTITTLDGTTAVAGVPVIVRLMPVGGWVTATGAEVAREYRTVTDASGVWTLTLTESASITPANTYYEVTELIPRAYGGPRKCNISVGAPNQTLYAALISTPPSVPVTSYLTQAAGDARYVLSPGSFGASGDLAVSRPNDTAAGGSLDSYARTDHKHDREITYGTAAERAALSGNDLYEGLFFTETDSTDKCFLYRSGEWKQVTPINFVANSAARPTNPHRGMWVVQDDTGQLLMYYGATTLWQPPWSVAWGELSSGYASITANSATATSIADVASLTVTVSLINGRRYRTTVKGEIVCSVADGAWVWTLADGSNNALDRATGPGLSTASTTQHLIYREAAGASASVTRKLRQQKATGTGNVSIGANSAYPAYIQVEDIGPASASAPAS